MQVFRFTHEYFDALGYLLATRKLGPQNVPAIGFIAIESGDVPIPAAVGFLREVEGRYAIFEGFVTNSYLNSEIRNKALELVVNSLLNEAKALEVETIIAWTKDKGVLERAMKCGFLIPEHTLICKSL